jgi:hypothetical protein
MRFCNCSILFVLAGLEVKAKVSKFCH